MGADYAHPQTPGFSPAGADLKVGATGKGIFQTQR
jgi:hypothetical protein